jgi:hypothetical protein
MKFLFYPTCVETENRHNNEMTPQRGCNRDIILLLCIIAACRIFLFNAAFPLFNNVDEQAHFDLVYKYSKGHLPRAGGETFSRGAAELILLYGTPEYLSKAKQFPKGLSPKPLWTYPNIRESREFAKAMAVWQNLKNHETASFPVYYIVAGIWCNVGRALGMTGGASIILDTIPERASFYSAGMAFLSAGPVAFS